MRRREGRADLVGEIGGDQPVDRLALGRHGAALGGRDVLGDLASSPACDVGQAVVAEAAARGSARDGR